MKTSSWKTVGIAAVVAVAVAVTARPGRAGTVNYQMVTVGDPGNAGDSMNGGRGSVGYWYEIGKYEVTIGQYAEFLNAVAKTDTYGLYNSNMGTDLNSAGISRSGSAGNYSYSVMNNGGSSANRPITYVSWFDAARFANWIANGQPTGSQNDATTEDGAYDLNGATTGTAPARNGTNPNTFTTPSFWIPTENEWYKAAYYSPIQGGPGSPGYWLFATQSSASPPGPGNYIGGGGNNANYAANGIYAVTWSNTFSYTQNYLTDVGAFYDSTSYYGTFDQSGNVVEWNDLDGTPGSMRGLKGGDWMAQQDQYLSKYLGGPSPTTTEDSRFGFRLAGPSSTPVPEIDPAGMASVLALVAGALGLLEPRRMRRGLVVACKPAGRGFSDQGR